MDFKSNQFAKLLMNFYPSPNIHISSHNAKLYSSLGAEGAKEQAPGVSPLLWCHIWLLPALPPSIQLILPLLFLYRTLSLSSTWGFR